MTAGHMTPRRGGGLALADRTLTALRRQHQSDRTVDRFGGSAMTATISRILTPAKSEAWHVVGHPEARALLADERIGLSHPDPSNAAWYTNDDVAGRPQGGSDREY